MENLFDRCNGMYNAVRVNLKRFIEDTCIINKDMVLSNLKITVFDCSCTGCIDVDMYGNIYILFGEDVYRLDELSTDDLFSIAETLNKAFN